MLTARAGSGTNVQTGPNGEVYVCWASSGFLPETIRELGFASSVDGGVSFNLGFPFQYAAIDVQGNSPDIRIRMNDYPSMAVDRSCGANRGKIYVAYPELNDQGNADIHLRHSTDNGASFSDPPILISTDDVEQAFFPWVACDPVTGIVVVTYHGLNPGFPKNITKTYVAYSSDGGNTFDNIKVSDSSHFSVEVNHPELSPQYAGDYIGIDIYDGIAYAAWADSRAPNNLWQVYVSKLDLRSLSERILSTTDDLIFNDVIFNESGKTYRANKISITGNSQVNSNIKLQLVANNNIDIIPDFKVPNGAEFKAYIDPFACQTPGFVASRNANLFGHSSDGENTPSFEKENEISIYPNPVSAHLTIECKTEKLFQIRVLNIFGAEVMRTNLSSPLSQTSINLSKFPSGPYFLEIETDQNQNFVKKIIIQH